MLVLLVILAALQHRWLGEVSNAERERMRSRMQESAARFAREFDRELTQALLLLGPDGPRPRQLGGYAERRARWQSSALIPEIVRAVFLASRDADGALALARIDESTGILAPVEWPQDLAELRSRLESERPPGEGGLRPRRGFGPTVPAADVPALVVPSFGAARGAAQGSPGVAWSIVWLDGGAIGTKLLPELAARHFAGADGIEYRIEIASVADPAKVVYRAGPPRRDDGGRRSDVEVGLFGLLRSEEFEAQARSDEAGWPGGPPPGELRRQAEEERLRDSPPPAGDGAPGRPSPLPQWRLRVTHPSGSLEAAVAAVRHRNLAISFGTLLLLAVAMGMLLVSTRRAQRLARQQLEFTAGVTHELATPLAGMRSAAQNLTDGVVRDPAQVKEYGSLIDREGRRLTEMVDQVLAFAGMQSGRTPFSMRPLRIHDVIEEALASSRRALDQAGLRVETEIAPGLPEVIGDAAALRRVIENLIGNAVKYAAGGSWVGVRARLGSGRGGPWVEVTVEDRGPGIAAADLPHVFEPFYRGRGRAAGAVPGTGLGLTVVRSIVEAHGGRVTAAAAAVKGALFTLSLPARGASSGDPGGAA